MDSGIISLSSMGFNGLEQIAPAKKQESFGGENNYLSLQQLMLADFVWESMSQHGEAEIFHQKKVQTHLLRC